MAVGSQRRMQSNSSPAALTISSAGFAAGQPDETLVAERSVADRIAFARAFGFRMAAGWWRALTSHDYRPQPLRELFPALQVAELAPSDAETADTRGEAIARFGPDVAADQIGLAYTSMLPREHRAAYGIYYTPSILVRRLIDQATVAGVDWTCARVLDPACGGGAFLAPVARRIIEELRDCSPRILVENIATRLHGCELDPFGAWLSQVTLDAVLLPVTREAKKLLPVVVTVGDSLCEISPREHFDLVIGNPPYGRTRLEPDVRAQYRRSLYGHANLYGLFTDLALRHAKRGGIIAYVTPTSFLAGEYFKNLRALLAFEAPPVTIDFIAARKGIFEDVLQETLLATYCRGARPGRVKLHEITPSNAEHLNVSSAGAVDLPTDSSQPWVLPRRLPQAPLVSRLANMRHRLADWGYTVSTGPLVWNRYKDQLATRPGGKRFPLIWAEAVTPDGRFVWRADKKNHTLYFEVRRGDDWLITNRQCVLVQRTTAKEQSRRLVAAALPANFVFRHGAVVIENHLNMVRPVIQRPSISAEVLAAFFNSAAADQAFRCVSGSVAVSAYELEALPLPAPDDVEPLARLVRDHAPRERLESACARLYGDTA
jgi:adenine-specific DNA-methyltransferase